VLVGRGGRTWWTGGGYGWWPNQPGDCATEGRGAVNGPPRDSDGGGGSGGGEKTSTTAGNVGLAVKLLP